MAVTKQIRLGIVGGGAIAENAHVPAALSSRVVELTALSDTNDSRLRYLQQKFSLRKDICFADYRDVFTRSDAVIIALPNHLHATVGCEFLSRGVHVLCEKPLATSLRECETMLNASRATGAVLAVGYYSRFFPSTNLLKQLLETRLLGRISSFEYEFGTEGGWAPFSGYNLTRKTAGGGVLVVSGSHFIDRMLHLFGSARVLSYKDDSHGGVEANCVAVVQCQAGGNSVEGHITLSKTHRLTNKLSIAGENGRLEVREGQSEGVTYYPSSSNLRHEISDKSRTPGGDEEDYFKAELEDFIRAIQSGGKPMVDGQEGSKSVALIEECYSMAQHLDEPWVDQSLELIMRSVPVLHQSAGHSRQA
jgi:predicted dehydrogenase